MIFYIPIISCQAASPSMHLTQLNFATDPFPLTMSWGEKVSDKFAAAPAGLWLIGRLQHQNCEVNIITRKCLTMKRSEEGHLVFRLLQSKNTGVSNLVQPSNTQRASS